MKKKALYLVIAGLLMLSVVLLFIFKPGNTKVEYGINLLKNANFEQVSGEDLPDHWLPDAYQRMPGVSLYEMAEGRSGQGIYVRNVEYNDARFMQTVAVAPNTLYELSGYVKADAQAGLGASISIADVYASWDSHLDTQGQWEQLKVYGRTGPGQRELTVYARLGGYSSESIGVAWFDELSLMALEQAPSGVEVNSWEIWKASSASDLTEAESAAAAWPWLLILGGVWVAVAIYLAKRAERVANLDLVKGNKSFDMPLLCLLIAAFVSRVLIGVLVPGYGVDVGCFTAWSDRMYQVGPVDFYITDQHSDYPPGYMLALWPIGLIGSLLGSGATEIMIKMPAILADVAAIALLYSYVSKLINNKAGLLLACVYAFNPLVYVTGAAWGQVDSVPAVLMMLVVLLAYKGKWGGALPIYTLSVLMKPQALMFGPLGLAAFVLYLLKDKDESKLKKSLIGMGLSLAIGLAVVLPFSPKQDGIGWLIELYSGTMTFYGYATVNATNLYFLFGLNWQSMESAAPFLLRLVGALSLMLPTGLYLYQAKRDTNKRELVLMGLSLLPALAVCLLPLSLSQVGTLLMVSGFCIVLVRFIFEGSVYNLPLLGAVMLVVFCALGVMMHERYLFPAVCLLMLSYAKRRDKSIFNLVLAVSVLTFLNVGIALDRAVRIGGVPGHLTAPLFGIESESAWLEYLLSAGQVLMSAFAVYVGLSQSRQNLPVAALSPLGEISQPQGRQLVRHNAAAQRILNPEKTLKTDRKDWLIILAVTLVYALVALTNLGSMKAPQTAWVSGDDNSEIVLDLGEARRFNMLYYGGIHHRTDNDFEVSVSSDLENWTVYNAQMEDGDCFVWMHLRSPDGNGHAALEGRYLRIKANYRATTLMEVLARDADSNMPINLSLVSGDGQALIDEQDSLEGDPSWYNSAYFDEIYHARTGYEHANAIRGTEPNFTYEVSHPPLGKVFMALSILTFGMTPFAWRLPGAMAGVLMLPVMYLIAKLLTKKRLFGFAAISLLALDGMHFAQTRIATIDSFVTLFIIWAYYFMFRYALDKDANRSLKDDFINLGLSGIFMGLGIASKWTGMYAGVGLAVIFFYALVRRIKEGMAAQEMLDAGTPLKEDGLDIQNLAEHWKEYTLLTLAWCVLMFMLVPAVIYYLSFLPWFMRTPGGLSIQKVWDASVNMFNYHSASGLGMDHPYFSPWYEWPLILRPFYFYAGKRIGDTGSTIMSFGNPAVWWGGFAAVLVLAGLWLKRTLRRKPDQGEDIRPVLVIVGYLAQYVPWMLVPRGTYLYHYFPSVPFIILASVLALYYLYRVHQPAARIATYAYLVIALVLFIGFFPYYSGIRVSASWLNAMRWFPRIYY